jgi:3-methyladenine DNA glycosylase/8-oxoguanine DNA glycosylase
MPTRTIPLDGPLELDRVLGIHVRGGADPTLRVAAASAIRASRFPSGPATVRIDRVGDRVKAEAWGPGADEALARLPALLGQDDDRGAFRPELHPLIAELDRRHRGVRIGRTGAVLESLIPAILEQKVTGREAWRGYRGLIRRWGEPAPGPFGLRLAPRPGALATAPYHEFHPLGVERRRADLVRRIADRAARFEEIVVLPLVDAYARLTSVPGIGPWTAAEVAFRVLGDADAVSVGDFHLPNVVAWSLAGEPRADDARMLELLEPWRGQRARVIRLLEIGGLRPPAFGPRMSIRSIAAI